MGKLKIADINLIPQMLEEHKTIGEIAKHLGVSRRAVSYWMRRLEREGVKLTILRGPRPLKLR